MTHAPALHYVACLDCGQPTNATRCPNCARAARPKRTTDRHTGGARYRRLRHQVLAANPTCAYCGRPATEVDHIVPVAAGGTTTIHNLAPACRACNRRKGAKAAA